jgi:hypothetical protein
MTRLFALVLVCVLMFAPFSAQAAIDKAGAAHLTGIFTKLLDEQKISARLQGQDLKSQGEVLVEPAGSYYAVTLPHLSLVHADSSTLDLGILVINAMPGSSAQEWKMTLAIPTPIIGYDAAKKPISRLDIGKQSFTGVWNESINNFSKLDARYENITSLSSANGATLKIPKAAVIYDLTRNADGKTWSGPTKFTMENITLLREGNAGQSKIGRLTMDTMVQDYSYEKMREYQQKMTALSATASAAAVNSDQLADVILDMIGSIWGGFGTQIVLDDVDLSRPAIPGSPAGRLATKQIRLGFDAKGFAADNVTMTMKTQYDGLTLTPAPAGFNEVTPGRLNLDLTVENLPYKKLINLTRKTAEAASTSAEPQKNAGMLAAKLIPQMLTQAGTTLKINKSYLGNNTYNIDLDGQAVANMATVMGAVGKATLNITGLDDLIALTKAQMKKTDLPPDAMKKLQGTFVTLSVLQLSGQQGKDATGKSMRSYNLELTPEGKVMVNGADLTTLMTLAGAAAGQPKAAPAPAAAPVPPVAKP